MERTTVKGKVSRRKGERDTDRSRIDMCHVDADTLRAMPLLRKNIQHDCNKITYLTLAIQDFAAIISYSSSLILFINPATDR